jgi:metal-sulfur cluster biosynthetic enzyme
MPTIIRRTRVFANASPQNLTMTNEPSTDTHNLWRALEQVNDPEFPMSIVDMGLIYAVAQESDRVRVQITFTAMGCPAMDMILADVRARLEREPGVREVDIEIVWDPPWNKSRLSERGRELMQMWGIAV